MSHYFTFKDEIENPKDGRTIEVDVEMSLEIEKDWHPANHRIAVGTIKKANVFRITNRETGIDLTSLYYFLHDDLKRNFFRFHMDSAINDFLNERY
jgi:hypothetical protein